jgi:hypothetical protein
MKVDGLMDCAEGLHAIKQAWTLWWAPHPPPSTFPPPWQEVQASAPATDPSSARRALASPVSGSAADADGQRRGGGAGGEAPDARGTPRGRSLKRPREAGGGWGSDGAGHALGSASSFGVPSEKNEVCVFSDEEPEDDLEDDVWEEEEEAAGQAPCDGSHGRGEACSAGHDLGPFPSVPGFDFAAVRAQITTLLGEGGYTVEAVFGFDPTQGACARCGGLARRLLSRGVPSAGTGRQHGLRAVAALCVPGKRD